MENASKALLIAGSILVVILLIAVGMRVFNSTSGTTEATKTTMESTEIAMFNGKFQSYAGSQNTGSIRALINQVIASNATNSNDRQIKVSIGPTSGSLREIDLQHSGSYNTEITKYTKFRVNVNLNASTGYVNHIIIRYYES